MYKMISPLAVFFALLAHSHLAYASELRPIQRRSNEKTIAITPKQLVLFLHGKLWQGSFQVVMLNKTYAPYRIFMKFSNRLEQDTELTYHFTKPDDANGSSEEKALGAKLERDDGTCLDKMGRGGVLGRVITFDSATGSGLIQKGTIRFWSCKDGKIGSKPTLIAFSSSLSEDGESYILRVHASFPASVKVHYAFRGPFARGKISRSKPL